ncbi:MAG: hypothetical protein BWZ07_02120 [Alphaproteobacteria bacterium ADurb.BinA280]|jgi:uncharacterized membrane protein|nr:DUF979 domain-containing protein [Aquimonas sp.]OPZ11277.1 MAG: hypothetical protein BWZ07_02120 [Alphaproteobacteria bacterium ADurb.BinA280]
MIGIQSIYTLTGLYLIWMAWQTRRDLAHPRRLGTASFWGLLGLSFLIGQWLPAAVMGIVVLALALLAGNGQVRGGTHTAPTADRLVQHRQRFANRLFGPALLIPLVTVIVGLGATQLSVAGIALVDGVLTTQIGFGVACALAFVAASRLTRSPPVAAVSASRSLLDAISWASLLPVLLATLGSVFAAAGVGDAVAAAVRPWIDADSRFAVVLAYALGMTLFTVIMGNAFAAFPVMTLGIALPLLVQGQGADPAVVVALGMLCGYCGTLLTPMAANFNLVPAALLELRDPYAVIRAQWPTALPLLAANVGLMYWLV